MPRLVRDRAPRTSGRGKRPEERDVEELLQSGVLALDKMQGPTSHQVTAWVRDVLHVDRIGHGGTLDPNVSGVLPIALGRATRLTDLVLRSDKQYVCHMLLHRDRPEGKVREVISTFIGDIYQVPPVRAAVKRQMRVRHVHTLDVLEIAGRNVLFRVDCDAGTYIRTLCVDVGEALGVGANMAALRRTRSGSMREDQAVSMQDLADAYVQWQEGDATWLRSMLMPMETLLEPLPKVVLKDSAVDAVCHGADLAAPGVVELDDSITKGATVAIMSLKGEVAGLGIAALPANEIFKAEDGLVVRTQRVLMVPGTYAKGWTLRQRPA
jgi:H/ACA ribonucleoprotein complex subunit 4